jgi:CBS domain-containing protein
MRLWRVRDVMTRDVITASDQASVAEIAAILSSRRISGVPIVDGFDVVVGVVSWADLRAGTDDDRLRDASPSPRRPDGTARQVMSTPPRTIDADASLPAAARTMYRRKVDRLVVVDGRSRMLGVVTRSDLLKVHARLDSVIRDEVTQRVLHRTLAVEPGSVQVTVDDGVVTLTGRTRRRTTALAAAGLAEGVAGVTQVVDRLTPDIDDTVAAPASEPVRHDPVRGWWAEHHASRPARRPARRAPAGT